MSASSDRPVIVVGCARSGTTLVQVMIQAHPRLAMPPENRFMMAVYRRRDKFGDLRDGKNREAVARFITERRKTKFRDLGIAPEAVRQRFHEVEPTIGSLLGSVLALYAERHGKARWGDKRPNYIQHLDVILRLFPDAQIVHVIRDGRDCVASLKHMPWWTFGYPASVYKWVQAIKTAEWARANLRPDQYHEVRYEDLVARPRAELERMCAFLGEALDEAMLAHHRSVDEEVPDYKGWHDQVRQPVSQAAVQRWQRDLTSDEIRLFEFLAARQLVAAGYEPSLSPIRRFPSIELWWEYRRFLATRQETEAAAAAEEAAVDARYPYPVAARLTSGQRRQTPANADA